MIVRNVQVLGKISQDPYPEKRDDFVKKIYVERATHELKVFTEKISKELEENVFGEYDDVKVISHTKTITNLKLILYTVKHDGPIKTVATKAD